MSLLLRLKIIYQSEYCYALFKTYAIDKQLKLEIIQEDKIENSQQVSNYKRKDISV